jgi:hypothetical protein
MVALLSVCGLHPRAAQPTSWLDRPLAGWNAAGAAVPRASVGEADRKRCNLAPASTGVDRVLESAGWIAQPHLDRALVSDDVEIVAGVSSFDGACAPASFNLFVFSGGRFAGTLSPVPMSPRVDGVAGAVRFVKEGISAEFARYKPGDADCCPSARVAVTYRVDRSPAGPSIVPVNVRTTRSY